SLTSAGPLSVRGGEAPDSGGTGGYSGMVYLFSDNDHNAKSRKDGNLLIDTTGVIDASGGNGGMMCGHARRDGKHWAWPSFPIHQEQIAIFLNCDGVHGKTLNWMDNRGKLIAHGGVPNGHGGDIMYHGIRYPHRHG